MKIKLILKKALFMFIMGLLIVFSFSAAAAETYKVDSAHTYILFRVKHLNVGYSYARLNEPAGQFIFDEASPMKSMIEMQVNAKNVDTDVDKRDKHLRSADFFNVAEYPLISFKSTSVKKLNQKTYEISGDLTLLGKTRPITVKANDTGSGKDPWGNYRRGFESSFTIKRSEFGMNFMIGGVSDEVDITVSVEGIRQ